jgi:phage shock protein C
MVMHTSQLYRSRENRVIAGVAGGLAEYFQIDASLIRLIWICAIFCWGGGLLAYLLAWLIIPERKHHSDTAAPFQSAATSSEDQAKTSSDDSAAATTAKPEFTGSPMVGLILIAIGLFLLLKRILPWHWFQYGWPLFLIIGGVWLLVKPKKI